MVVRQCGWTCSRSLRPQGGGAVEENQQNMVDFFATFPQRWSLWCWLTATCGWRTSRSRWPHIPHQEEHGIKIDTLCFLETCECFPSFFCSPLWRCSRSVQPQRSPSWVKICSSMEQKVILFHGNYWAMFLQSQREEQKPAKTDVSNCTAQKKLSWNHFVSVSFNLQSPAIHQRPVEEPEILLKAEDIGGEWRIHKPNKLL